MSEKYKLVVIGAGPGGYVAAIRAAQLGLKTAIVEKEYFGGVCLNWGCIPSKTLLYATELKRKLEESKRIGIEADNIRIDIDKLRRHKEATVKRLTGGVKLLLEKAGVTLISGAAEFKSASQIEVVDGSKKMLIEAENYILATGASPLALPMLKHDGVQIIGAREAIDLKSVPESMLVVGAGPIGVEMATVYHSLGSKVTIVELLDRVLPTLDEDLSSAAEKALKKRGIKLMTSAKVTKSAGSKAGVKVSFESAAGKSEEIFTSVLVAAGMKPNSGSLKLDRAGVKVDGKGFVQVNSKMQTNMKNIYAIGDLSGGMLLAHKASHEGMVAAEVIGGSSSKADWKAVPYAVFSDPEIAGIGMTEKEAVDSGRKVKVGKFPYAGIGKAVATLATDGFAKIISDAETDELLGIHIFGPHAGDIILAGTALMEMDGTTEDLSHLMGVHPTLSEALGETALAVHGRAIHIPN